MEIIMTIIRARILTRENTDGCRSNQMRFSLLPSSLCSKAAFL